jgi:non-ribosomal peptide synthetase component F
VENQIGFYINMLVLRDMVRDSVTFEFFLQQVKQTVTEALEHQNYPFDRLVDELNLPRDFSRSPLFDVMVNLLPSKSSNLEMTGLIVSPFINETFTNLFDINFMFKEMEGGIQTGIQYNTDLFKRESIENMATDYVMLLETVINQPSLLIKDLRSLFTSAEESKEKTDFIKSTMELSEDF